MEFLPWISIGLYLLGVWSKRVIIVGAFVVQVGYLLWRGLSIGRLPLVGLHDTLVFLSLSTAAFGLVVSVAAEEKRNLLGWVGVLCVVFTGMAMLSRRVDSPLPPVLKTYWFELHVVLSFLSYGLFGVASVVSFTETSGKGPKLQYLTAYTGYILFSLSMVFGGIWAYFAWGTYWLWTPKEIWTTVLWLTYTVYLHLRFLGKDYERITLWVGRIGYLVVLFTYLGVGLLMKSSHSF
ncbi:MAG: cytochrome C biogenesis protein ResC [Nitrospirae bacterium]|nr:MAG: cytochrome C biogenesis protein ResC [Nitrospirota bacterium]